MKALPAALSVLLLFGAGPAVADNALGGDSLVRYVSGRKDLGKKERAKFLRAVKKRFGGTALERETAGRPEIGVAKSILSAAIFMRADPDKAAYAAWEGWRGALGYVPPPVAIHYEILRLQGRKPRGRPIDLAFNFPDYYNEEIAPDLVAYWEDALKRGAIPDDALTETEDALARTRVLMRPLLLDKLRLLARLDRERAVADSARRAEITRDMSAIDDELDHAFSRVARRPAVLDRKRRAFDRLRIQLDDMGQPLTAEDRYLDPTAAPPPKKPVPRIEQPKPPVGDRPDVEPSEPWIPPVPDQPRAGDPEPPTDPMRGRSVGDVVRAYGARLQAVVKNWLGTPYRWGSDRRGVGTDCSGFSQRVMARFSVDLPRVSRDQFRVGRSVSQADLRPGDLVFFDTRDVGRISHVGIYAGEGKFAHASSSRGVVYDRLRSRYFRRAYRGARRVLAYPLR